MKKILIVIVIVITILLIVILKNSMTTKYSHDDIVDLLNQGMQKMDNISFDCERDDGTVAHYYKGNKSKLVSEPNGLVNIKKDGKSYLINKKSKCMYITQENSLDYKPQYSILSIERANANLDKNNNKEFRYRFVYIKDEKIDDKDCIFVKQCKYYLNSKEYVDDIDYQDKLLVYWIEKSTGLVIGSSFMDMGENKSTPQTIIKNVKYGEVTDNIFNDIFNLPSDYKVLEN